MASKSFYVPGNKGAPLAHISIDVTSYAVSKPFYTQTFSKLGWDLLYESEEYNFMGFGPGYMVVYLIQKGDGVKERHGRGGTHFAFAATSKQAVIDWWETAIKYGATDYGKPGIREEYSSDYFAAYVLDPDGYRIEAVYRVKE